MVGQASSAVLILEAKADASNVHQVVAEVSRGLLCEGFGGQSLLIEVDGVAAAEDDLRVLRLR